MPHVSQSIYLSNHNVNHMPQSMTNIDIFMTYGLLGSGKTGYQVEKSSVFLQPEFTGYEIFVNATR